jgi:hypothetical protein
MPLNCDIITFLDFSQSLGANSNVCAQIFQHFVEAVVSLSHLAAIGRLISVCAKNVL